MMMSPQHPPGMPGPSSIPYSPLPSFPSTSTTRKRRAASPDISISTPLQPTWSITSPSPTSPTASPILHKRRRPNLANGFSGLSINPRQTLSPNANAQSALPTYEESEATKLHIDDNDDEGAGDYAGLFVKSPPPDDLQVEVLQDRSSRSGMGTGLDSGSNTSGEEDEGGEMFGRRRRLGVGRRFAAGVQEGVVVEQPEGQVWGGEGDDLGVEDVTAQYQGVKRRGIDGISGPGRKRRRNGRQGEMDVDMDGGGDVEMGSRRRRTQWHEPEKDRIVITSLGSPDSSASERSLTPDPEDIRLAQPGTKGFTLNPSFLTHLLSQHKDDVGIPFQPKERGLVLYRPLGIQPGLREEVVQEWKGYPEIASGDAARFEEIDDDEFGEMGEGVVRWDEPMMDMANDVMDQDGDVPMDVE